MKLLCTLIITCLIFPLSAFAQGTRSGLSLSVTPTLFEMSAAPSQTWNSAVKVINNNSYELTVYASVVNFAPQGESGEGKFLPVFEEVTEGATLAEWITINTDPIIIPAEQSVSIPVLVQVPEDAAPGGHFAAILIGTRPLNGDAPFQVTTSQIVTSLFFVRIAGDVIEDGVIREFRTTKTFVNSPQAEFEVRFENKGNVHLQPQGEIVITNMWGKERGVIPINQKTHFGNVLPESIRKFEFTWKGEASLSDVGRYKATIALAYGLDGRKYESSSAYFYVVPVKALGIVLGSLIAFVIFVSWMIKAYVRRMLLLAGVEPGSQQGTPVKRSFTREGDVRIVKHVSMKAPVERGMLDLRSRLKDTAAVTDKIKALGGFVIAYRIFFISLLILVMAITAGWYFILDATTEHRDYEVLIENSGSNTSISSEDVLYDRANENSSSVPAESQSEQNFSLVLVNSSDTPGLAASLQTHLQALGYSIDDLRSDFEKSKEKTVIVYDVEHQNEALALSKILGNALLSAALVAGTDEITIFIGNDYERQ